MAEKVAIIKKGPGGFEVIDKATGREIYAGASSETAAEKQARAAGYEKIKYSNNTPFANALPTIRYRYNARFGKEEYYIITDQGEIGPFPTQEKARSEAKKKGLNIANSPFANGRAKAEAYLNSRAEACGVKVENSKVVHVEKNRGGFVVYVDGKEVDYASNQTELHAILRDYDSMGYRFDRTKSRF